MKDEPLSWPTGKLITFVSAMNLIKEKKLQGEKEVTIKRHDVYLHMLKKEETLRRVFGEEGPWESLIYKYMEELTKARYFEIDNEMIINGKRYQELSATQDAERLRQRLWIAINLRSKEDIGNIVRDALKGFVELDSDERENIVKSVMREIERRSEIEGLPFASLQSLSLKEIRDIFNKPQESKK
jgi:hypothetical protein